VPLWITLGVQVVNMRTSVRMIEMYYSDVVPDDVAKRLEGDFG